MSKGSGVKFLVIFIEGELINASARYKNVSNRLEMNNEYIIYNILPLEENI